jgi:hypothetical protein
VTSPPQSPSPWEGEGEVVFEGASAPSTPIDTHPTVRACRCDKMCVRIESEMSDLETRLSLFFDTFSPTLELVDDLIRNKSHAQEIIILTCSRLDALASTANPEDAPKKESFVNFVCNYGQQREFFEKVSVSDLHYELGYYHWLLVEGLLMDHGRLYRYSRLDDVPLRFIDYSDIPLLNETVEYMLSKVMHALSSSFRVKPGQPLAKSHIASIDEVLNCVTLAIKKSHLKKLEGSILKAIEPLVRTKVTARILYEKFRSEVIHGGHVRVDEKKFFSENSPYWTPYYSDIYGSFCVLEFPAKFLRELLERCIETYKHHLIAKGVVPIGIHWLVFGEESMKYLEFIDEASLGEYGVARLKLPSQ